MDTAKSKTTALLHFSEAHFEKNLSGLKNTQDCIQSLSSWCLQNRQHHKKIVNCWFKVLKKVKMESRLILFYLANDVIQYSKRKNYEFVNTWAVMLPRAVTLVRDDKIKPNIQRIFKIWTDRGIYDDTVIADLTGLLESPKGVSSDTAKLIAEFQPLKLIDKIRSCKTLEDDTDLKLSKMREGGLDLTDADALRNNLKDRRHGTDQVGIVEEGITKIEAYVASLKEEIKDRTKLIDLLEQGSVFYDHQKGEAKIVVNAYRNFGTRVKNLKRKLDELMPTLPSPVPSPDINAPSPSPDSDTELELPDSKEAAPSGGQRFDMMMAATHQQTFQAFMQTADSQSLGIGMGSFMGAGKLPFELQAGFFQDATTSNDTRATETRGDYKSSEGKRIEVIDGSRGAADPDFNVTSFFKSLVSSDPTPVETPAVQAATALGLASASISGPPKPVAAPQASSAKSSYTPENIGALYNNLFSTPPPPPPTLANSVPVPAPLQPMQPPPVPPTMFLSESNAHESQPQSSHAPCWGEEYVDEDRNSSYSKLPPKFPIWNAGEGWNAEVVGSEMNKWEMQPAKVPKLMDDTPMSPPMFEKEGFNEPVEYDDRSGTIAEDVDHRVLMPLIPAVRPVKKDIDHRNLISLTGASSRNPPNKFDIYKKDSDLRVLHTTPVVQKMELSMGPVDQDYRQLPLTPVSPNPGDNSSGNYNDNVESVDMEMSDEDEDLKRSDFPGASKRSMSHSMSRAGKQNSNGPHRHHSATPMQAPRPLMASAITPPSQTPPVNDPSVPGQSKSALLPTPQMHPVAVREPMLMQESPGDKRENGEQAWEVNQEKEWTNSSEETFMERIQHDDQGEECNNHHQGSLAGSWTPRTRGRRGNQGGPNNHFGKPRGSRGGGPHFATASPGFSNRGFRGSFRPFRGTRRPNFNRW